MSLPLTRRLLNVVASPSHLSLLARDGLGIRHPAHDDRTHLEETIGWLCRAADATGGAGVSAGYSAGDGGWLPPYPETTGYIITTLLAYAARMNRHDLVERAVELGDWEIDIQFDTGAVRGGIGINDYPIVFNTGQVLNGWVALFRTTQQARFIDAARRAAAWLMDTQDDDGTWSRFIPENDGIAYYTYVAWPMLQLHRSVNDERVLAAATAHLEWVCTQANDSGWFDVGRFDPRSLTHYLGYTIHGLLECAIYVEEPLRSRLRRLATVAADRALTTFRRSSRPFAAALDKSWNPALSSSCVTGDAQFAHIWLMLYAETQDTTYLESATRLLEFVKTTQSLASRNPGIRGAIPGSYPCWGPYFTVAFPNWAAKFFADALMLRQDIRATTDGAPTS